MSFLSMLEPADRGALLGLGRSRTYPPQATILYEGDEPHTVVVVCRGDLKVSALVGGREVVLDVLCGGDVLGEVAVLDARPRSASAVALTTADVVLVPAAAFMTFLAERPNATLLLLQCLARRLPDASRRQVEYGALDAVGRVCRRLVELMERYGEPTAAGVVVSAPLTQADIAAWAGLSREAVVKALQGLRRLGWITTATGSITVLDRAAVSSRAAVA